MRELLRTVHARILLFFFHSELRMSRKWWKGRQHLASRVTYDGVNWNWKAMKRSAR